MTRLTERDEFGNADIIALSDVMPELYAELSFSETNALTDALNKLGRYEDAEEKGLLVNSPCKVGDTVWTICAGMAVPAEVCMIADKGNGWFVFLSSGKLVSFSDIFLTLETAQQALKADEKEIEPTPKPQTNFERIKAMSIEELAADNVYFIPNNDEFHYTGLSGNYRSTAKEVVEDNIKWLESEVSE